jgi:AraC family transcriptional activator of pyochelin receptor
MAQTAMPAVGSGGGIEWIIVSPEMTTVLGDGPIGRAPLPPEPVLMRFAVGADDAPSLRIGGLDEDDDAPDAIRLIISRRALLRLGGRAPTAADRCGYHLPTELRTIALSLADWPLAGEARDVYRLAKSIELSCETVRLLRDGKLLPLASDGGLSFADTQRLIEARRLIDERWHEKLTLDSIARACGLNRAKLTSGFRTLYACTVAEALAARRLDHARRMLRTTDKPVSSIGYENGYLNNASFARAFNRHFGLSPSDYRACRIAA